MRGLCSSCWLSMGFRGSSSRGGYSLPIILWVLSSYNIVPSSSNIVLSSLQYLSPMGILSGLGWALGAFCVFFGAFCIILASMQWYRQPFVNYVLDFCAISAQLE